MSLTALHCPACGSIASYRPWKTWLLCQECGARGLAQRRQAKGVQRIAGQELESREYELAVEILPLLEGRRVFRDQGLGDVCFTLPLLHALQERGESPIFVGPSRMWPLVWGAAESCLPHAEMRPGDVDLRGFLDDVATQSMPNRPYWYAQQAGLDLDQPTMRLELSPAAQEWQVFYRPRDLLTLAPVASQPHRTLRELALLAPKLEKELDCEVYVLDPAHRPSISVEALIGLLAASRLVVGTDSGPLYIASAAGTPVVGLYPTLWPPLLRYQQNWSAVRLVNSSLPLDIVMEAVSQRWENPTEPVTLWGYKGRRLVPEEEWAAIALVPA